MRKCDVLIIGGGPAGSTCAWKLNAQGFSVIVMDKAPFPRDKVCAGWITPAVIEALQLDVDDYCKSRVFQEIKGFRTGPLEGECVLNKYRNAVSYGIRRVEFDHYLLKRSGAFLELGKPVNRLELVGDHWIVNERISASMLIGAGGHFCPVARHLGVKVGQNERSVLAQEIELELDRQQLKDCPIEADTPELYFYPDRSGYGWIFRKHNFINIGLGREDCGKIGASVDAFTKTMQQRGKIPSDLSAKYRGHSYVLYDHAERPLIGDRALLIGDAAGLAYSDSGEGIRPAVESALIAADVIYKAAGRYEKSRLQPYADGIRRRFGRKLNRRFGLMPESLKRTLAGTVLSNRVLSRHLLINRMFLHRYQAPLK